MSTLLLVLDLVGTFVFALAGATAGVRRRLDIFGVAALAGASVVAIGGHFGLAPVATAIAGALLCFALRMVAIHRDWQLPKSRAVDDNASQA